MNEIVFQGPNWKTFSPMMRDDFTLFDAYEYVPPPPHIKKGEFPVPIHVKYLQKDKRCKKHHLEGWKARNGLLRNSATRHPAPCALCPPVHSPVRPSWQAFTTEKLTFTAEEHEGNHLFFYDVPARAKWMESILAKLPPGFGTSVDVS